MSDLITAIKVKKYLQTAKGCYKSKSGLVGLTKEASGTYPPLKDIGHGVIESRLTHSH